MARSIRRRHERIAGFYHAYSRVAGAAKGYYPFENAVERRIFAEHLQRLAQLFFVRVGFYAFMGNHFHLLFEMLSAEKFSVEEIRRRYELFYAEDYATGTRQRPNWEDPQEVEAIRKRLADPSNLMHDLKGEFAAGYNLRHDRRGPFWDGRFGSTLLDADAVARCARYIELNPLRAGLELKVGEAGRNSWYAFEKACGSDDGDFRKHPGFPLLMRCLHPDETDQLSPEKQLELALKLHADWREHFAAEEKRVAEERTAAEQEKTAPPAQAQRRSLCGAIVIGGLEFCRRTAARLGLEIEPEEIEPGLFGLFRRYRRHA